MDAQRPSTRIIQGWYLRYGSDASTHSLVMFRVCLFRIYIGRRFTSHNTYWRGRVFPASLTSASRVTTPSTRTFCRLDVWTRAAHASSRSRRGCFPSSWTALLLTSLIHKRCSTLAVSAVSRLFWSFQPMGLPALVCFRFASITDVKSENCKYPISVLCFWLFDQFQIKTGKKLFRFQRKRTHTDKHN